MSNPKNPAKPPPPVRAAKEKPPAVEADASDLVDEAWLTPDDVAEGSVAPVAPEPPSPPPPISRPLPVAPPAADNPFLAAAPPIAVEETPVTPNEAKPAKPASLPPEKRSRAKVVAFVLVPVALVVGGGVVYETQLKARPKIESAAPSRTADTIVEPPPSTPPPPPPPTHTTEPPPSASASAPKKPVAAGPIPEPNADPAKTGILDTTALPAGRKVIVDGHYVGSSPRRIVVRCGTHSIKVGDLPPESLALPCGGEISFTD